MFLEVQQTDFTDLHDIYEKTAAVHAQNIENKTFCVRVKRTGKHEFNSIKVEQYVGGGLNQQVESIYCYRTPQRYGRLSNCYARRRIVTYVGWF